MFVRVAVVCFALLALVVGPTGAQLGGLPEVEFSQLSQQDPNPLGAQALAIHPEEWKHAETEHFIYHFVHGYVATPVSTEAEFQYRVVVKELQREPPVADTKSHIYIFERPEDWEQFQKVGGLEPWTGGIHSQGSLFMPRSTSSRSSDNTLGHEITHLIMHRFYPDGIPRWLDEGFAQYTSKNSHASYQRARGYLSKPQSQPVAMAALFRLSSLATMNYPTNAALVEVFYDESERLVRFLVATDKPSFLAFLDALSRHQPFETALQRCYPGKFPNMAALEVRFREYASNEYSPTASSTE
ncbi:MAG: hypothetical protein ABI992_07080 [Chthoniobacterales bacterium]